MNDLFRLAVVRSHAGARVVVEREGKLLDLAAVMGPDLLRNLERDPSDLMPLLEDWEIWRGLLTGAVADAGRRFELEGTPAEEALFVSPIAAPGKLVCIGANYHDHVAEMPIPMVPDYPYSFLKPPNNTLRGSGQPVCVPRRTKMMDWEAELAVVIGRFCSDVPAEGALDVVAGYCNFNDLSARDWIASRPPIGIDWVQHKAFDGFAPIGPYLVPAHFIADPQDMPVRLSVNGVSKQDSSTRQMIFGIAAVIAHLSTIMTLFPGDIIATGTPAGVGLGRKPPEFLKAGDVIRMQIGPLGELVTPII